MRLLAVTVLGSGLILATRAGAQICAGSASFRQSPVQLTASGGFNSDGTAFGGGLAVGGSVLFAAAGAGRSSHNGGPSTEVDVEGGIQFALNPKRTSELCPVVSYRHSSGPHDYDPFGNGLSLSLNRRFIGVGVDIGGTATLSNHVKLLPSASLNMLFIKRNLTNNAVNVTQTTSENAGLIEVAFGFLFNDALTARPNIVVVTGVNDNTTTFGVDLTVNLGRRGEH